MRFGLSNSMRCVVKLDGFWLQKGGVDGGAFVVNQASAELVKQPLCGDKGYDVRALREH